jgi:methionine-rich copper-binding protein CopC
MTDFDGEALTPDTQEVKVYDPGGTLKFTETSPIKKADGLHYIVYTFPEDGAVGKWTVKWKIIKSGRARSGQLSVSVTNV